MRMIVAAVLAAAVGIINIEASAQVTFNAPMQFRGTGCDQGTAYVTGDGTDDMIIKFNAYDAAKPSDKAASKLERTACSFVVPVKVPQGIQVSTMTADWRGFADGQTELFREYFFAGTQGPQKTTSPSGNYTEHDDLAYASWSSGCNGGIVPMRINSSVRAISNPSYIKVDEAVRLHLTWRQCRQ